MAYLAVTTRGKIHVYRCGLDLYEHVAILLVNNSEQYRGKDINVDSFTQDHACVIGNCDNRIIVWDISSIPTSSTELPVTFVARDESYIELTCSQVWGLQFNKNGDRALIKFYVRGFDGDAGMVLFDWANCIELWRISHTSNLVCFARRDELIITATVSTHLNEVMLYMRDSVTGSSIAEIRIPEICGRYLSNARFAVHPTDACMIVSVGCDISIHMLMPEYLCLDTAAPLERLRGHEAEIVSLNFSDCGAKLVSGCEDGIVRVWNAVTWENMLALQVYVRLGRVIYNCTTDHIVCSSYDHYVRVYDGQTGHQVARDIDSDGFCCFSSFNAVILM
jgi:WD40 repeat protein